MRLATMWQRVLSVVLGLGLAASGAALLCPPSVLAQQQAKAEELARKVKAKVSPVYPEAARRLNITGTVRLAVVVAPNGSVKSWKPLGGHPLLVNAATDAVKKWKFDTGPTDSSGVVEFRFNPQE